MKEQLLRLFQLVALRGGPLSEEVRDALEQVLGIICQRDSREALAKLACDILEQLDWSNPSARTLYSEDGIWAAIPQKNGTDAFIEAMYWKDKLGGAFAGIALGVLPMRFVYSRLHEPDAMELISRLVTPNLSDPNTMRFPLLGLDDPDSLLASE